jgi:hypothetical protein
VFRERLFNVPLECLGSLSRTARLPYDTAFEGQTIFDEYSVEPVYNPAVGFRSDAETMANAIDAIGQGCRKIFVPLVELDGLTHRTGLDSVERAEHLRITRRRISDLWQEIVTADSDAIALVVSDHGFAPVSSATTVDTRALIRVAGGDRAKYLVDATILRVWCADASACADVEAFLSARGDGHVLSSDERKVHGIRSELFGDIIYLLDEGRMFLPSVMTKRTLCAAMHGYEPTLPSQWGVAACSDPIFATSVRPIDFYRTLAR